MNYIVKIDKYKAKYYYLNDLLHRNDGPAVEYADGTKVWYKYGKHHKDDGPAIEYPNGTKIWYKNNKLHRDHGPAIKCVNRSKEWYLNNICYGLNNDFTANSWKSFIKTLIFF